MSHHDDEQWHPWMPFLRARLTDPDSLPRLTPSKLSRFYVENIREVSYILEWIYNLNDEKAKLNYFAVPVWTAKDRKSARHIRNSYAHRLCKIQHDGSAVVGSIGGDLRNKPQKRIEKDWREARRLIELLRPSTVPIWTCPDCGEDTPSDSPCPTCVNPWVMPKRLPHYTWHVRIDIASTPLPPHHRQSDFSIQFWQFLQMYHELPRPGTFQMGTLDASKDASQWDDYVLSYVLPN